MSLILFIQHKIDFSNKLVLLTYHESIMTGLSSEHCYGLKFVVIANIN